MSPFFIGGWKSGRQTSSFGSPTRCSHCGQLTQLLRYDDSTHATAFFVPVFKLSSSTGVVCSRCGASASAADIEGALEAARVARAKRRAARDYLPDKQPGTLVEKVSAGLRVLGWALEDATDGVDPQQAARNVEAAKQQKAGQAEQTRLQNTAATRKPPGGLLHAVKVRAAGFATKRGNPELKRWLTDLSSHLARYGYVQSDVCWGEKLAGLTVVLTAAYMLGNTQYTIHVLENPRQAKALEHFLNSGSWRKAIKKGLLKTVVSDRRVFMVWNPKALAEGDLGRWLSAAGQIAPPGRSS